MNLRSTRGLVVQISEHGESDKLVTFYSRDLGRITGIAKGARKSRQRFVNKLEPFSALTLLYRPPRAGAGLYFIAEAELLAAHLALRLDCRRFAAASYFCELVLRFTRDNDPDPQLYELLSWTFTALEREERPANILALAHLHLLDAVGYRPQLDRCGRCGQPIGAQTTAVLLPGDGSLMCSGCHGRNSRSGPNLSVQTLGALAGAQQTALNRLERRQLSPQSVREALTALHLYTAHILQQDLRSWPPLLALLADPGPR